MEALATSKHIRISARKARQVANLIRGKSVDEAVGILALTPKKASPILKKIVLSAAANVKFKNDGEVAMDNGSIVEQGSHDQLMNREGHYSSLVAMDLQNGRLQ